MRLARLVVMVSGGGTNLQALMDGIAEGEINARISGVISSKEGVYALERAKSAGIPTVVVRRKDYGDSKGFDCANLEAARSFKPDGIVLAGYLSIIGPKMIEAYSNRIINIHPSLIPAFCGGGAYGLKVHAAALDYGVKVTGATTHFVDEGTDTGPIIMQDTAPVLPGDMPETLQARVLAVEHRILRKTVALFCENKLSVSGRHVIIL